MATQKPISTISYNTEAFLKEKLEALYKAHIISAYMYICHKGEGGDKDHIHLRIEPNKRIDAMELKAEFVEFTASNPKPLGCMQFRPSKEEDWLLYAVHDSEYMRLKYANDESEKIPYKWEQIVCSADYMLETAFIRAKQSLSNGAPSVVKAISQGKSAVDLISEGANPFTVNSVLRAYSDTVTPRVIAENNELRDKLIRLDSLLRNLSYEIERLGYDIEVDDDGNVRLLLNEVPFE